MTDMRIVKVVVEGELPKSCKHCELVEYLQGDYPDVWLCWVGNEISRVKEYVENEIRPTWCPLVKESEDK